MDNEERFNPNITPAIQNLEYLLKSSTSRSCLAANPENIQVVTKNIVQSSKSSLITPSMRTEKISTNQTTQDVVQPPAACTLKHHRSRAVQTNSKCPRTITCSTQTDSMSVADFRFFLNFYFPQSSLLSLPSDQFTRIITGNITLPFSLYSIMKANTIQKSVGALAYEHLRREFPNLFPGASTIRRTLASFKMSPSDRAAHSTVSPIGTLGQPIDSSSELEPSAPDPSPESNTGDSQDVGPNEEEPFQSHSFVPKTPSSPSTAALAKGEQNFMTSQQQR